MTRSDLVIKRSFDLFFSCIGLLVLWPVIGLTIIIARLDTGKSGLFSQTRLGQRAKPFTIYKIRTMNSDGGSTITAGNDERVTAIGAKLRKWKLDELPQLYNVMCGDMSFVGPRPDVAGYLDQLGPEWQDVLDLRPGITGPATLFFRNEEELLAGADDPKNYNDNVIWPKKLKINRQYAQSWSFLSDLHYLLQTVVK
ncbi:MAG: sugar transferase [Rhizobiaceae bacterium]